MSVSLKEIQEKIDGRILRERVLIFLSAIALLFMLWNFFIHGALVKKLQESRAELAEFEKQHAVSQGQIMTITQALLSDPARLKKEQISQLKIDINAVESQLQNASQSLIKADQLPQALQDVLQKTSQLTLLEVATLPIHELKLLSTDTTVGMVENNANQSLQGVRSAGVYEHAVELRVGGSYFQVLQFLTALEGLPWRFYWQQLDYKVTQYPNAEIILRVYTLSSEEGLLGV
jgi:MSHA biogenesis protein MshJ